MRLRAFFGIIGFVAGCSETPVETSSPSSQGGGTPALPSSTKPACTSGVLPTGGIPSARADSSAALREDGAEFVIFGGDEAVVVCGDAPKRQHLGDTWILDTACGGWTKLDVAGPSPRARHVMVSDVPRNRALLFGGRYRDAGKTGNYTLHGDLWAFEFATREWTQLKPTGTGPTPRANSAAILDGDTMWVFGGTTSPSSVVFAPTNDLYALDLLKNEWRKVDAVGPVPAPRLFHAMAVDPVNHRAFLAYGGDANAFVGPFLKDLHELDLATATWTTLAVTHPQGFDFGRIKLGLSVRSGESAEPRHLVAFGGHDDVNGGAALGNRNDVLTLDLEPGVASENLGTLAWQHPIVGDAFNKPPKAQCDFPADFVVPDVTSIERRSAFAFAALPTGEAFVVFGGDSDCGRLSDAWWFDTRQGIWTAIVESLPGLTCPRTGNVDCKSLCN